MLAPGAGRVISRSALLIAAILITGCDGGSSAGSTGPDSGAPGAGAVVGAFSTNDASFLGSVVIAPDLVLLGSDLGIARLDGADVVSPFLANATDPRRDRTDRLLYTVPDDPNVVASPTFCRVSLPGGALDPTFGEDLGCVSAPPAQATTRTIGMLPLPGGGYVALLQPDCFNGCKPAENAFGLLRLDQEGKRDLSFGAEGYRRTSIVPNLHALSVVRQSSGALVVSGYTGSFVLTLLRITADGSLDPTFGDQGFVSDVGAGKLLDPPAGDDLVLMSTTGGLHRIERYGKDGAPDPGFGASGKVDIASLTGSAPGNDLHLRAAHVDAAGRTYVGGGRRAAKDAPSQPFVLRLTPDGALDTSFGEGGIVHDFGSKSGDAFSTVTGIGLDGSDQLLFGLASEFSPGGQRIVRLAL